MANTDLAFSQLFGHEKDKEHYGILVAAGIIFYVYGPEIAETTVKYAPLFLSMMLEPQEINKEDEIDNLDDIKNFKSIVISNRGNEILDNSEETNNFGQKGVNIYYTKKQSRKSGKELGNDYPGWSDYEPPEDNEDQEAYLKRILDKKYGKRNWKRGPKSDYNQIKKAIERGGHKAWNAKK